MHGKSKEIPIAFQSGPVYSRDTEWGEMNVAFEGFPAGMDTTPLFNLRSGVRSLILTFDLGWSKFILWLGH